MSFDSTGDISDDHVAFPSKFDLDDEVYFIPPAKDCNQHSIARQVKRGRITAIRFTKTKVLHDIVDNYYGHMFKNVDSALVFEDRSEAETSLYSLKKGRSDIDRKSEPDISGN